MNDELLTYRIFKEQIRKELIDEIKKYQVGWCSNGELVVTKSSDFNGYIFIIPTEQYQELFK